MASCKQLSTSIVQGIVIGHCSFHNFKSVKSSNLQRSVLVGLIFHGLVQKGLFVLICVAYDIKFMV